MAAELHREVGYQDGAVPVDLVAQTLGAVVRYAPYQGELAGMLILHDGHRIIAVNSSHHKNRQRFTIAHECGHLRLHEEKTYVDKGFFIVNRDGISSRAENIFEIEANQFAADLLMPHRNIIRDLRKYSIDLEDSEQVAKMSKVYGVSSQAMSYRIANLLNL